MNKKKSLDDKHFEKILNKISLDAQVNLQRGKYELSLTPWELEHFIQAFLFYVQNKENTNIDFFERPLIEDLSFVLNEEAQEKEDEKNFQKRLWKMAKVRLKGDASQRVANAVRVMHFNGEKITERSVMRRSKTSLYTVQTYLKFFT